MPEHAPGDGTGRRWLRVRSGLRWMHLRSGPLLRDPLLRGLSVAVVVLLVAALVLPFAGSTEQGTGRPALPTKERARTVTDHQLARRLVLRQDQVPPGWLVDRAKDGPLSGFLGAGGKAGSQSPEERRVARQVAAQFERCMAITSAQDRFFGPSAASGGGVVASSPAFAAPASGGSPAQEVGSTVSVYRSARVVRADVAQLSNAKFPACFGAALGSSLVGAASSNGTASKLGQPEAAPLAGIAQPKVTIAGTNLTIPVNRSGTVEPIQFGIVLIGGLRAEATVYTFSDVVPFPAALQSSLSLAVANGVASRG